jgi:hypothetical protein
LRGTCQFCSPYFHFPLAALPLSSCVPVSMFAYSRLKE